MLKYVLYALCALVVLGGLGYGASLMLNQSEVKAVDAPADVIHHEAPAQEHHEAHHEGHDEAHDEGPMLHGLMSKGGFQLHDNDSDLRLRTNEFYTQDQGKKMFLDSSDVGSEIVGTLDTNTDGGVSYLEYTN